MCETISHAKYNGYCARCCIYVFPEIQVSRNYKTKEADVVNRITETFSDFTWVKDKKIMDGCSRRRPDLLLDVGSHIIIVEIDENKHNSYDCSCENKRIMEISRDLGHRPTVFIRFNPDEYIKDNGEIIKVLMITAAGSEGINLRNTRYVHIMEPYWHPARVEQVIGRARRLCSHQSLPVQLQTVEVFLYLILQQYNNTIPS